MTPVNASASSAVAISGTGWCALANQLFLQRAQRTVRPAAPSEAFSIAYDVEQFGQTICMGGRQVFGCKGTSRPLMHRKPWQPPETWEELLTFAPSVAIIL
jgi:hypothetical protein